MEHVSWTERPTLAQPVLIAAFEGWNDAGDAASGAARYLVERWELTRIAEIDSEEFYDFTSTRPEIHLDSEGRRTIEWPVTEVFAGSAPDAPGQDVVVVVGAEPQLRWRTYCAEICDIADELGVRLAVSLGALLAEVPHTRPTPITASAEGLDEIAGIPMRPSRYEGPTGIVGVLQDAWRRRGITSASLWATVPSYVPGAPSPKATLALLERLARIIGTQLEATDLEIATASYERQVTDLVEADEETSTYVASLEERHDADPDHHQGTSIADEVERFLRDQ